VTTRTEHSGYLESLLAGQPALPPSPLSSLNALRAEAVDLLRRIDIVRGGGVAA